MNFIGFKPAKIRKFFNCQIGKMENVLNLMFGALLLRFCGIARYCAAAYIVGNTSSVASHIWSKFFLLYNLLMR